MTAPEQRHMASALGFELAKVATPAVRARVLSHLRVIDETLAQAVAGKLGVAPDAVTPAEPTRAPEDLPPSPALSQLASRNAGTLKGRHLALLVGEGADATLVQTLRDALQKARARFSVIAEHVEGVALSDGGMLAADAALSGSPSCLYGAVLVVAGDAGERWQQVPAALDFLRDAWRHLKAIGLDASGLQLADAAGIGRDDAVVELADRRGVARYLKVAAQGKQFAREGQPGTD